MRAKSVFFHVIILAAIIGTAALGVWQLHRREWKHALIAETSARLGLPPVNLTGPVDDHFHWRYAKLSGTVDYTHALKIPRFAKDIRCVADGTHGMIIVAPVRLADGSQVLLRTGWFQGDALDHPAREHIQIIGVIHPFISPWMAPYDAASDSWFLPAPEMYDHLTLPRLDYYVDNASGGQNCHFPQPLWEEPELPDNHLQYAITWFALAAVLTGMYAFALVRKP